MPKDKGIRTLIDETRPCPHCGGDIEILAIRRMVRAAEPGEYETSVEVRKPSQKTLEEVEA
jgi:hypothetical protein